MFKAPTKTPSISILLDDLPTTDLKRVARHLGLSVATIKRYAQTNNAPRLVHLALFWETSWGLSRLDCDIWNRDSLRLQTIRILQDENAALRQKIVHLVKSGHFGAANDPLFVDGVAFVDHRHGNVHHATFKLHNQPQLPNAVTVIPGEWPGQAVPTACRVFQLRAL